MTTTDQFNRVLMFSIEDVANLAKTSMLEVSEAILNRQLNATENEFGEVRIINDMHCWRYVTVEGDTARLWHVHKGSKYIGTYRFSLNGIPVRRKIERTSKKHKFYHYICYVPDGRVSVFSSAHESEAIDHAKSFCLKTPGFSTKSPRPFTGRATNVSLTVFEMKLLLTMLPPLKEYQHLTNKLKAALSKSNTTGE